MKNGSSLSIPVIAGLAVGVGFILLLIFVIGQSSSTDGALKTITGEVVCLPHKKGLFGGVETSECAIGFRVQDGRYYGFGNLFHDESHDWLFSAQGSKELFNVTGNIRAAGDDLKRYDIAGVIDITSAARADGTTSIYEVYGRHYNQLSGIIEEIGNMTRGGYSIGIDEGCDDLGTITDGKTSCILIVLEKDVPELSSKIPKELEGYPVHVVVQPSSILTTPALTEDQAIDIMKSDLAKRVGDDVLVFIYPRDARDPEITENPLPLIYYRQEDNMAFRINGTTHSVMGSCAPSVECFFNNEKDVLDSMAGNLFYFIDGSYSGEDKSSPVYYYVDAMSGNILWSYIGEDMQQVSGDQQSRLEEAVEVNIDFSPILAESDIVVKKGQTVKVPVMIESDRETEKVLTLSIMPYSDVPTGSLALSLDKETIVLSKDDIAQGKARDYGSRLIRDAGFLTISASPAAKAGTFEFGLEANYQGSDGGMGAGQAF